MSAVNEFYVLVMLHFLGFCAFGAVFEFCMERFIYPFWKRIHDGGRK